ncbi:ATP-binding protein [Flavobacterium sp. TAB 87]|uniref:ATP-binding protein n=1 Tax=Flavobacterium sp. TAB 87 TaxID=1729581 RepID=UPI00076D5450|nr:DUF4175 family protein [Flavobacterium sp. TAB 87]KVV13483.1 hypothetical protein AP058_02848 [Flavobacterium sp. TAB 87]
MNSTHSIYQKLEDFIKKYYTNELIRGILLFIGLGLLYLILTVFVEYFLWLQPAARTFLFWIFVVVEILLLVRFIVFPIFKLLKLKKGIDYKEASIIIGNHFSEVNDKLINFLQLSSAENNSDQSELLLASIEQKANSLQLVPFSNAVNFKTNKKYLPLALIPLLILFAFYISGNSGVVSQSLNRVVHFNAVFLPPAPFEFVVLNKNLQTEQHKDFLIVMETKGNIAPENVSIRIGSETYFMENSKPGRFEFKIEKPKENVDFIFEANSIASNGYVLKVVTVPTIANFDMILNFPLYLGRKSEIVKGSGNAIVPEGTRVIWKMNTQSTQSIDLEIGKASFPFAKSDNSFVLAKNISQNAEYQIVTSNNSIKNYEKLSYQLSVVKDQFPSIQINAAPDSLRLDKGYLLGQVSDDYGVSKVQIVYYERSKPQTAKRGNLAIKNAVYDQFVFSFPSNLPVRSGVSYDYYFEVFDNDAPHNFKSAKSAVFSDRVSTADEVRELDLEQQNTTIKGLEKSLENQNKQFSELDKLEKLGKKKDNLDFKEQQKVNEFIKRQEKQDDMMKQFAEKLNQNLDKMKDSKKDERIENLQKRLENADKDIEKNQKLLEELKNLNEKLDNQDLFEKLEKFKQVSKNQSRNLEQLVELTKRYYVNKKAEQLADQLSKLSNKQEQLSNKDKENVVERQNEINKAFEKIQEELKSLQKENGSLKAPLDLPKDGTKEKEINSDLQKASAELEKKNTASAKQKQKSAAKKMKEMSSKMEESMAGGEQEQLQEDIAMLRQVLDNLLAFSLSQESVMLQFKGMKLGSSAYNRNIKVQQNLEQQFRHVDDSLFALSLRNPKVAEEVTKEIGYVQYNIDNALESLVEVQVPKGVSHQQYAVSASNRLADFLSDLLSNMQNQMSGSVEGKPKPGQGDGGMQLPDIIKKQKGLGEKLKQGTQEGKDGAANGGEKNGKSKDGKQKGEGGDGEGDAEAIMEIYKQQVELREALQKELAKQGINPNGQNAVEQMKQLEKQLLNKGFKNENLHRVLNIQQELLKLDNAIQQQGEDSKRNANTNKSEFRNPAQALPASLLDYLNSVEILNRQSLPLQSNFNQKVQEYFNKK